jgi:hypothetical protein
MNKKNILLSIVLHEQTNVINKWISNEKPINIYFQPS